VAAFSFFVSMSPAPSPFFVQQQKSSKREIWEGLNEYAATYSFAASSSSSSSRIHLILKKEEEEEEAICCCAALHP
jgi:hypothetical protein